MKTFIKVIVYVLVIAVFAGVIGIVYKFTNGFNEDFKTFYIEYNGEKILSTQTTLELESGKTHTIHVKYTFDKEDAEPKDYSVKVVPHMTKDFDYTVNGERFLFSKIKDLTSVFKIDKKETSFDIEIPQVTSLKNILSAYHNGANVEIEQSAIESNPAPFTLVISSYNEKVVYNIGLKTADMQVEELKVWIDGEDVTDKRVCFYGSEYYIDVYAKVNGEWIYVSEVADISSELGGDLSGNCLSLHTVVSAYDYATLCIRYGGESVYISYCTHDEGEDGWESL